MPIAGRGGSITIRNTPFFPTEVLQVVQTVDAVRHGRIATVGRVPLEKLAELAAAPSIATSGIESSITRIFLIISIVLQAK